MDSTDLVTPTSAPVTSPVPAPEVAVLQHQLNRMLRAVVVLAVLLATAQGLELWRCWRAREAARTAGQLRYNLQNWVATLEEFRRVASTHPDLAAIGRKYGLEPVAATNRGAARP